MKHIELLNKQDTSATYDMNEFGDLTAKEFRDQYMSGLISQKEYENMGVANITQQEIPENIDWREHGVVSEVKHQGKCGSCWAFSAIGNIEGQFARKNGRIQQFSEQQLVDCDKIDYGCSGGYMMNAFTYIQETGRLMTLENYQYTAKQGQCLFDQEKVAVRLNGFVKIESNETEIAEALVQYGPLAIAVDAGKLQFYSKGIFNPIYCSKYPNHAILLVGYGKTQHNQEYWILKNSYGKQWGSLDTLE